MKTYAWIISALFFCTSWIPVSATVNSIGQQPQGTLSGKIIYLNAGHGYTAEDIFWNFQRPYLFELNEDLNNQDAVTLLVDYLWNAGATIVPLRPVGHQTLEIVIDNDDPEVEYVGAWTDAVAGVYFGDSGNTPFRTAATNFTQTAYARFRPTIPASGFWPVYCWTGHGVDRVPQLYRITHSGGISEVIVDHRMVGNGLVYLGTYFFAQGTDGFVDVSNRTDVAGTVVADMIRFGNGMGDIVGSGPGTVSGLAREDEAGLYWIEAHTGQGIPETEWRTAGSIDRSASVSAPTRWAEQMNREAAGVMTDRVYLSYHANASGNGVARGTQGFVHLYTPTPNQSDLSNLVATEINDDLVALNGMFEHNWFDRTSHTFAQVFGEISNSYINGEFDATLIERAFIDNQVDAELLRDAKVGTMLARATYQGLVRYFNQFDGGVTPLTFLPDPVTNFRAVSNGDGTITLGWDAPLTDGIGGDVATGFRIYTSTNGRGFDGGTPVSGGMTTSHVMDGLNPADGVYYFKVVATNSSGESLASQVLVSTPHPAPSPILVVNGFNRIDRQINVRQMLSGDTVDRVRPAQSNSRDYTIQVAQAIETYDSSLGVDSAGNEAVILGDVLLDDYQTVIWILGLEATVDQTLDSVEQGFIASFVSGGGNLFISGAEIGWDLVNFGQGVSFYNNTLHANYIADDANTYSVFGETGSIFAGMLFDFAGDWSESYDVRYPDVISPRVGAQTSLSYLGGIGAAAIQYESAGTEGRVVMLAFPFEAILGEQTRADVMAAVIDFLPTAVSGVDDPAPQHIGPGNLQLTSHPNPFNPTTRIGYFVPHESRVRIRIYTVDGRHVRTLRDRMEPAGTGSVVWDGLNKSSEAVSSGVFLYQVEAAEFIESRRITLVR